MFTGGDKIIYGGLRTWTKAKNMHDRRRNIHAWPLHAPDLVLVAPVGPYAAEGSSPAPSCLC